MIYPDAAQEAEGGKAREAGSRKQGRRTFEKEIDSGGHSKRKLTAEGLFI